MSSVDLKKGFFTTTRGKILLLLRRSRRTVKELAEALGLAENAVRSHLTTMERYGLIEQGIRRTPGAGKPAYEYSLTSQAQSMFPVAHSIMLDALLSDMEAQMNPSDYEERLRAMGRLIADRYPISSGDLRARLEETIKVLDNLGAVMELEVQDESPNEREFTICGYSCPLGSIPLQHPLACKLVESMITQMAGVPVSEHCERGEALACRLDVSGEAQALGY